MSDYYLKFTSEQDMWSQLLVLGLAQTMSNQDGADFNIPVGINLDIIGQMYKENFDIRIADSFGIEFPSMDPVDGFHANIRGELTEEQQAALPLIPAPATPYRVWA
jgi:hypothetical protein